ncbi:MAG: hypothetical protein IKB02_04570 [Clostridia bacterium]|nr:hypothetical protein [Clostridia bacterium]
MVSKYVRRTKIVDEFTEDQLDHYFGHVDKKTLHHIDTLYYTVWLNEPDDIVECQSDYNLLPDNLAAFLQMLCNMKAEVRCNAGLISDVAGMDFTNKVFSTYEFCISLNECFDIFIAKNLPTKDTPRILVQLRSRFLVIEGVKEAIDQSMFYLRRLLSPFELIPVDFCENRIDYAFHTNLIHNPKKKLKFEYLNKHLKSNLRTWNEWGKIGDEISIDTLSLGSRKSNNVFFRMYNKTREVCEQGYKAFFIERWFEKKLISRFDKYVYEEAFKMQSYRTGCLYGRLKWYIEFGTNEEFKEECKSLIETCFIDSNNLSFIESKINGYIPEPTVIMNIEYQTKRRFYLSAEQWLGFADIDELPFTKGKRKKKKLLFTSKECDPLLKRIYTILANAPSIIDYLTGFGNCVSFVRDRKMSKKDFLELGEKDGFCDWWKCIRECTIDYAPESKLEFYRSYDVGMSMQQYAGIFQNNVARMGIMASHNTEGRPFSDDLVDTLSIINDNDMVLFDSNSSFSVKDLSDEGLRDLIQKFAPAEYSARRKRKARQLKPIIEKLKPVEPEKESI